MLPSSAQVWPLLVVQWTGRSFRPAGWQRMSSSRPPGQRPGPHAMVQYAWFPPLVVLLDAALPASVPTGAPHIRQIVSDERALIRPIGQKFPCTCGTLSLLMAGADRAHFDESRATRGDFGRRLVGAMSFDLRHGPDWHGKDDETAERVSSGR